MDIAGDGSSGSGGQQMKLRPRKSVLTDISNKLSLSVSQITDATKKAVGKKRKLSSADVEADIANKVFRESNEPSQTENPIAAAPSDQTDVEVSTNASNHSSMSTSSSANLPRTSEAFQLKRRSISRSLPLRLKLSDPSQCLDIIDDMYEIYLKQQDKYAPQPYMTLQHDINYKMRSILIDWLVEVHFKFKLFPSTLWLCVNLLDRFLGKVVILRSKLQLIGVTALFIACKFEEIFPPEVRDCVYITDFAYERVEVLKTESQMLGELNYEILVPTGYHFMIRYLNTLHASERTRYLTAYYAERNLQEPEMLQIKPHIFAAAAVYAALKQQNTQYPALANASCWPTSLQEESGLKESDLLEWAVLMIRHVSEEPVTTSKRKLIACKKKYASEKYQNVSSLILPTF